MPRAFRGMVSNSRRQSARHWPIFAWKERPRCQFSFFVRASASWRECYGRHQTAAFCKTSLAVAGQGRNQDAGQSGTADLFRPIRDLLSGNAHLTWVFTGDSITHGALHTMGCRSYPEHFAERLRWELQRRQDVVINTGISGDRMSRLLQNQDWRVWRFQPDVVSLMMGMNDCTEGGPEDRCIKAISKRF